MSLSKKEKFSYGVGALGKDMVYAIVSSYIMFYFNDLLGIDALFLGTLFLAARIFDGVNDPVMGIIVDNTRSRFGKFRPWIFIGTVINALVLVALFYAPPLKGSALMVYASVLYVLWGLTYTIMDIPYWSMLPALSMDQKEREEIAVIPRIFANIGFMSITVAGIPLVKALGRGDDLAGFFYLALIIAVVFVATISITVTNVREKNTATGNEKITLKRMFSILFKNDQLLTVIIAVVLFNMSTYITTNLTLYFCKYDLGNESLFAIFGGVAGVAQIIAVLIFPLLTRKWSRKQVFVGGSSLTVFSYLLLFIFSSLENIILSTLYISAFLIFFGFGLVTILTTVMLADTVEYGEWKLKCRSESIIFSMQTFVVKFASAISGFIVGAGLKVIKFVPNQVQSPSTLAGLRFIMTVIPICGFLLSLFIYLKYFKLDKKMYDTILEEIKQTREVGGGA